MKTVSKFTENGNVLRPQFSYVWQYRGYIYATNAAMAARRQIQGIHEAELAKAKQVIKHPKGLQFQTQPIRMLSQFMSTKHYYGERYTIHAKQTREELRAVLGKPSKKDLKHVKVFDDIFNWEYIDKILACFGSGMVEITKTKGAKHCIIFNDAIHSILLMGVMQGIAVSVCTANIEILPQTKYTVKL